MRRMKKLFITLLTVMMFGSFAFKVHALEADGTVTVSGIEEGDTVNLYQVLEWVTNDGWTFVEPFDGLSEEQKKAVLDGDIDSQLAETIAEMAESAKYSDDADGASLEFEVDPGLYLVLVTPKDAGIIYNPAFVASDYDGDNDTNEIDLSSAGYSDETILKKQTITVEKTADGEKETSDYSLGDILPFTITTNIPSYPANSTYATLTISDTPTGLSIDPATLVVKVGSDTVYDKDNPMSADTGTVTVSAESLTVDFAKAYILANGSKTVTITYMAELTSVDGETGTAENPVTVTYNPNPFIDTDNDVDDIDKVYTYGIVFEKVDENGDPLEGATFDLYDADGNKVTDEEGYFLTQTTVTKDGHTYVYWSGLKAGTYTIKETEAPEGYNKAADLTVTVGKETATADNPATADVVETNYNADNVGDAALVNEPGTQLPATGGIGTTIFHVLGAAMILTAGVIFVARKRAGIQK